MRKALIVMAALWMTPAWAEDTPAPAQAPAVTAPAAPAVPAAPPAEPAKPLEGSPDEVICKRFEGAGSRLQTRTTRVCGTRRDWEDHSSTLNRSVNDSISRGTPRPNG
jgi:hypothetical protein